MIALLIAQIIINSFSIGTSGTVAPTKKIIHWQAGGNTAQIATVVTNAAYIDTLPFDGIVVRFPHYQDIMDPTYVASYATLYAQISPINGALSNLTHNYLNLLIGNTDPVDPFDDWTQTIANLVVIAQVARDAGLEGIILDTEEYSAHWWEYPTDVTYAGTRTLSEYQEQWRLRGNQAMTAIAAAWPEGKIIFPVGPWRSVSGKPADALYPGSNNWLGGYWFMGMWAAAPTKVIDGGELYYNRTTANFANWKTFAQTTLTEPPQSPPLIPSGLISTWISGHQMSFGIYDADTSGDPDMTASVLQTTIVNAMPYVTEFVWNYSDTPDWLTSGGGSVGSWQDAVWAARSTLGLVSVTGAGFIMQQDVTSFLMQEDGTSKLESEFVAVVSNILQQDNFFLMQQDGTSKLQQQ